MRIRPFAAALCLAVLALAAPRADAQILPAENHVVELGLMYWTPTPELTLGTDGRVGASANDIDFVREFGIEEKRFRELRGVIGRRHKLRASFVSIQYDAETTLQRTIVFQGRTFDVNAPATTDLKWDLLRVGYEWDFVSRERGFLGAIVDIKHSTIEASIDSPALTAAAMTETTTTVPTVGVIGRGYLAPAFSITGEFTGLVLDREEIEGGFLDYDIYATISFGRYFGLQGGYRSVAVDYLVDQESGEIRMKGRYFGAVVRF